MISVEETSLSKQIEAALNSGQAGLWIRTYEPVEVLNVFRRMYLEYDSSWNVNLWNCADGMCNINGIPVQAEEETTSDNPLAAFIQNSKKTIPGVGAVSQMRNIVMDRISQIAEVKGDMDLIDEEFKRRYILVMQNGDREITPNCGTDKEMLMVIQLTLAEAKRCACHLIILSPPDATLPVELQEIFVVCDHELPDVNDREQIIAETLQASSFDALPPDEMERAVEITGGLTHTQVESIIARSLAMDDRIKDSSLWTMKSSMINKSGALRLYRGDERFESYIKKGKKRDIFIPGVGGMLPLKNVLLKTLTNASLKPLARPRGSLFLGVPGAGKSSLAKALGNETGRPTLIMDVGALFGGVVGATEAQVRHVIRTIDSMAPCILFVDELEKAMGGAGGELDGGVSARMRGAFLSWMQDHESDVYFIGTCNKISQLPPEFTRAGRFDFVVFMDLPTPVQRDMIWEIYLKMFGLDINLERPDDTNWTGAEIRACCEKAYQLDLSLKNASKLVIPVYETWAEDMAALRKWASGRCLDAETGAKYNLDKAISLAAQHKKSKEPAVVTKKRSAPQITRRTRTPDDEE